MKKGDVVMIYEDPLTETKPEGRAKLLRHFKDLDDGPLECWSVQFEEDPDNLVVRRYVKC